MNVCVVFGRRSATLLYILYVVGGGRAKRAPGARRAARPNMTDQNTKRNLICVKFGTRKVTKSLITNLDPHPPRSKFRNPKSPNKMHIFVVLLIYYE